MTTWLGRTRYPMRVSSRTAKFRAGTPHWTERWLHWPVKRLFGFGGKRWAIMFVTFEPQPRQDDVPIKRDDRYHAEDCALQGFGECDCHRSRAGGR